MFILKKGHQPGVYVPLRALFLVFDRTAYKMSLVRRELWDFRPVLTQTGLYVRWLEALKFRI